MGTKTAFQAVAEMSGLTYKENIDDRRVLVAVAEQTEISVRTFYALAVAYTIFKNNMRISPLNFLDHLRCLPELGPFYNGDNYEGNDREFEK